MEKHKNYTTERGALATPAAGPEIVSVRLLDTCSMYMGRTSRDKATTCVCVCGVCGYYEEHMRRTCFYAYFDIYTERLLCHCVVVIAFTNIYSCITILYTIGLYIEKKPNTLWK